LVVSVDILKVLGLDPDRAGENMETSSSVGTLPAEALGGGCLKRGKRGGGDLTDIIKNDKLV